MSRELFKKVNKKRGNELKVASVEMDVLVRVGYDCLDYHLNHVEKSIWNITSHLYSSRHINESIFQHKKFMRNIENIEEARKHIKKIFTKISIFSSFCEHDLEANGAITCDIFLTLRDVVKNEIDEIINGINESEEYFFTSNINHIIFVLKELKTKLLKIAKDLAWLYVQNS